MMRLDQAQELPLPEGLPPIDSRKKELLEARITRNKDGLQGTSQDGFVMANSSSNSSFVSNDGSQQGLSATQISGVDEEQAEYGQGQPKRLRTEGEQTHGVQALKNYNRRKSTPEKNRAGVGLDSPSGRSTNSHRRPSAFHRNSAKKMHDYFPTSGGNLRNKPHSSISLAQQSSGHPVETRHSPGPARPTSPLIGTEVNAVLAHHAYPAPQTDTQTSRDGTKALLGAVQANTSLQMNDALQPMAEAESSQENSVWSAQGSAHGCALVSQQTQSQSMHSSHALTTQSTFPRNTSLAQAQTDTVLSAPCPQIETSTSHDFITGPMHTQPIIHQHESLTERHPVPSTPINGTDTVPPLIWPGTGQAPFVDTERLASVPALGHSSGAVPPQTTCADVQTELKAVDVSEMETDLEEMKRKLDKAERDATSRVESLQHQLDLMRGEYQSMKNFQRKSREVMVQLLITDATQRRKACRKEADKNSLKLVAPTYRIRGHEVVEVWQEGYSFKALEEKQQQLAETRLEIERQRRALLKRRPLLKGQRGDDEEQAANQMSHAEDEFTKPQVTPLPLAEYHQKEEILKLRAAQIKKEDGELAQEAALLERQKNLHVREARRIKDEDKSQYNNYPILHDRYLLLELLGKGGFSEVYKAYDLKELRVVACKIHSLNNQWSEEKKSNYTKHACREYNIHKALTYPKIVRLLDVFEIHRDAFCTVLEYCVGSDLAFYLLQNKMMNEREAKSIVVQVFDALRYLSKIQPPVIHYDLKPANILYRDGEIKITDFGLSKVMEDHVVSGMEMELTSQGAGTYWYLPPETFQCQGGPPKISSKVDVWSVGVIFYQCLYGKRPFGESMSQQNILQQQIILQAHEVQFPSKPAVSNETKDFIRKCLTYNKDDRPDVLTICEDPYLQLGGNRHRGT